MKPKPSVLFISVYEDDVAVSRYRNQNLAEILRAAGHEVNWSYQFSENFPPIKEDVVVFLRCCDSPEVEALVQTLEQAGKAVIYSLDDMVFAMDYPIKMCSEYTPPGSDFDRVDFWGRLRIQQNAIAALMMKSDCVLVSTDLLAEEVRKLGKETYVVGNFLSDEQWQISECALRNNEFRGDNVLIGYLSGTRTHNGDLAAIEDALLQALGKNENVTLLMVGEVDLSERLAAYGHRVRVMPPVGWRDLPHVLATLDVCLAPVDTNFFFNHGKSHIKWLEAAAVRVPTIASRTPEFEKAICHGKNGMLASTTEEWTDCIGKLAGDRQLRVKMGQAARECANLEHRSSAWAEKVCEVFDAICQTHATQGDVAPVKYRAAVLDAEAAPEPPMPRPMWKRIVMYPFRLAGKAFRAMGHAFSGS